MSEPLRYRLDAFGRRIWEPHVKPSIHHDLGLDEPERPRQFAEAYAGKAPAAALTPHDRRLLVVGLWERGWSDVRIAQHAQMSLTTTVRIRTALGLHFEPPAR